MNRKYISMLCVCSLVAAFVFISSCSKDDDTPQGPPQNVYVAITGSNGLNSTVDYTIAGSFLNEDVVAKFGAILSKPSTKEVKATIVTDVTLVDQYNTETGKSYTLLPANAYTLGTKNVITIPVGSYASLDSLEIHLKGANLEMGKDYVLPLVLKSIEDKNSAILDTFVNTAYLHVVTNNYDTASTISGGTLINRSAWSITASTQYNATTYAASKLLDNNYTSYWYATTALPDTLTVNMGASYTLKGINYVPNCASTSSKNYCPLEMNVYTSDDGITWTDHGFFRGTSVSTATAVNNTNPEIKTIKFANPVTAKYFRIKITKTVAGSNYVYLSEIMAVN